MHSCGAMDPLFSSDCHVEADVVQSVVQRAPTKILSCAGIGRFSCVPQCTILHQRNSQADCVWWPNESVCFCVIQAPGWSWTYS